MLYSAANFSPKFFQISQGTTALQVRMGFGSAFLPDPREGVSSGHPQGTSAKERWGIGVDLGAGRIRNSTTYRPEFPVKSSPDVVVESRLILY